MTHREEIRDALPTTTGDAMHREPFIIIFPDLVPMTRRLDAYWEGLDTLLADNGVVLVTLPSSEAEQFDRRKRKGFVRLGDIKREGFRALAYRKQE
jgi:hypothetical protein